MQILPQDLDKIIILIVTHILLKISTLQTYLWISSDIEHVVKHAWSTQTLASWPVGLPVLHGLHAVLLRLGLVHPVIGSQLQKNQVWRFSLDLNFPYRHHILNWQPTFEIWRFGCAQNLHISPSSLSYFIPTFVIIIFKSDLNLRIN